MTSTISCDTVSPKRANREYIFIRLHLKQYIQCEGLIMMRQIATEVNKRFGVEECWSHINPPQYKDLMPTLIFMLTQ